MAQVNYNKNDYYLEFRGYNSKNESGMSHKFYAIEQRDNIIKFTFGRIGKVGRIETIVCAGHYAAYFQAKEMLQKKLNKGYEPANRLYSKLEELFA